MNSCFRCSSVWTDGVNSSLISDNYLCLHCDGRKGAFLSLPLRQKLIVQNMGSSFVLTRISVQIQGWSLSLEPSLGCALSLELLGWLSCFAVNLLWHLVPAMPGTCPLQGKGAGHRSSGWGKGSAGSLLWSARFVKTWFKKLSCVPSAFSASDKKLYNPELFIGW